LFYLNISKNFLFIPNLPSYQLLRFGIAKIFKIFAYPNKKITFIPLLSINFFDYLTPLKAAANIKTLIPIFQIYSGKNSSYFYPAFLQYPQELFPLWECKYKNCFSIFNTFL
jgi:hypothetical protein